jgi:hypothetical protein
MEHFSKSAEVPNIRGMNISVNEYSEPAAYTPFQDITIM